MKFKSSLLILVLALMVSLGARADNEAFSISQLQSEVKKEFERHNFKKVIELYQGYTERHVDQFVPLRVRIYYSQSLAETGNLDESIESLQQVLLDLPDETNPLRLQYNLANLLFMQKRYEEAKKAYQVFLLNLSHYNELAPKTRERLAFMKGKKKDVTSLQLLDIETSLEAGNVPDGAEAFLRKMVEENQKGSEISQAKALLEKIRFVRTEKAKALLDEARRIFDEEKRYREVQDILDTLQEYADVADMKSVEVLARSVKIRSFMFPRSRKPSTLPAPQ